MKIVTGQQMAEIDRLSIRERGIPSLSLMERAGWAVASEVQRLCQDPATPIEILCGKGNNGGDGLVIARHLLGWGYTPHVVLTHPPDALSNDSQVNLSRYRGYPQSNFCVWEKGQKFPNRNPVVIDALLGTGSTGAPQSPVADLIRLANDSTLWTLSVDIPSGVDSETGQVKGEAIFSRSTVTFGLPKCGHFLREGIDHSGQLSVADIGFPGDLLDSVKARAELITPGWVRARLPRYPISVHKGDRGRIFIIAGSAEMLGAAILAAKAAIFTGSGLVTLGLPRTLNSAVKGVIPEVMTAPLADNGDGSLSEDGVTLALELAEKMDAVAIGPGLGRRPATIAFQKQFIANCPKSLVVDADGLFALSDCDGRNILTNRKAPTVITPHQGELLRLADWVSATDLEEDRWECCQRIARNYSCTLLLKGPATVIASEGSPLRVNRSGHPSMAQGGMGDVLTGILTSFLGQGLDAPVASAMGAYLHGKAGELTAETGSCQTISAGALITQIPYTLRDLVIC